MILRNNKKILKGSTFKRKAKSTRRILTKTLKARRVNPPSWVFFSVGVSYQPTYQGFSSEVAKVDKLRYEIFDKLRESITNYLDMDMENEGFLNNIDTLLNTEHWDRSWTREDGVVMNNMGFGDGAVVDVVRNFRVPLENAGFGNTLLDHVFGQVLHIGPG